MGFINELKKAFFGAKSVAKSMGKEVEDKAEAWKKEAEDWTKAQEPETEEEISPSPAEEPSTTAGDAPLEDDLFKAAEEELKKTPKVETGFASKTAEKMKDLADNVGEKLEATASELEERILDRNREEDPEWLKSAKEKTEGLGEKVMETGDKVWDKAKDLGKDMKGRFDDLVEKADQELDKEKLEEEIRKAEKTAEDVAEQTKKDTRSGGLLRKHESFFDKAARYAEGDYRSEGDFRIEKSDTPKEEKEKDDRKVKGFDDLDGDGDEIIDDAILDKD